MGSLRFPEIMYAKYSQHFRPPDAQGEHRHPGATITIRCFGAPAAGVASLLSMVWTPQGSFLCHSVASEPPLLRPPSRCFLSPFHVRFFRKAVFSFFSTFFPPRSVLSIPLLGLLSRSNAGSPGARAGSPRPPSAPSSPQAPFLLPGGFPQGEPWEAAAAVVRTDKPAVCSASAPPAPLPRDNQECCGSPALCLRAEYRRGVRRTNCPDVQLLAQLKSPKFASRVKTLSGKC